MLQFQSHSRSSEARDFALLIDNNSYVQNWSLIQISVILLTCSIQVRRKCQFNMSKTHYTFILPFFFALLYEFWWFLVFFFGVFAVITRCTLYENSSISTVAVMGEHVFKLIIRWWKCFQRISSIKVKLSIEHLNCMQKKIFRPKTTLWLGIFI